MTAWPLHPRGLDAHGLADGQYVVDVVDGKVTGWVEVPATGVATITAGDYVVVDDTDPQNIIVSAMTPLSSFVGGEWEVVFDTDGQIVYTEAP